MPSDPSSIDHHKIVSHQDWLSARKELLAQEREFTRLRDELNRKRRELPWEKVEKPYAFEGPRGKETLAELFGKKSQLVVYHFMFSPDDEQGCKHCSFWADNFNGVIVHLNHRDVSFVAVSRAPLAKIDPFKKRMGWSFKWVSSSGSEFNYDYGVSFTTEQVKGSTPVYNYSKSNPGRADREGASVFFKDPTGAIFHTYSTYARGIDMLNTAYHYLDLVPKGRDETGHAFAQFWVRRHNEYDGN